MSFDLTKVVVQARIEQASVKLVAVVLAHLHHQRTGRLFASLDCIAAHASISRDQARRNVRQLLALEVLEVVSEAAGPGHATSYRFNVSALEALAIHRLQEMGSTDATLFDVERVASVPPINSSSPRSERVAPMQRKGGTHATKGWHGCYPNKEGTRKEQGNTDPTGLVDAADAARPRPKKASSSKANPGRTTAAWTVYAEGFKTRYGIPPTRNAKANAQLAQLVDLVGTEQAPVMAAVYLRNAGKAYVEHKHPLRLLLADVDKLRVEANRAARPTAGTDYLAGFHD